MLELAMVTAAVAATTAFNIGHSQTVPRCVSKMDSNRPAARGKLMFRNHYSQVMLSIFPWRHPSSAEFVVGPPYAALVARQKAAPKPVAAGASCIAVGYLCWQRLLADTANVSD